MALSLELLFYRDQMFFSKYTVYAVSWSYGQVYNSYCDTKLTYGFIFNNCSLSLWRVVGGSKLMHLDHLIHGLFIT